MLIDNDLMFHDNTTVTVAAGYVGDALALSELATMWRESGGEPLEVVIQVTEAFVGGTSVAFSGVTGSSAALTSREEHYTTEAVPTAELVLGKTIKMPLSMVVADADGSHFGIRALSLGTHTEGKFSAWIQGANQNQTTING